MHSEEPIFVTRPSLAPLEEVTALLSQCWESGILTHNGPMVQRFERELADALGVRDVVAVTNGTIAMQLALRALDITEGEVITTPFSWIATCSAIRWERCQPVFVDVDPETFNIDPARIEAAITPKTRAILPVHVFSAPCEVEAIADIADRHGLRVIYDGAHAVGVDHGGRSIFEYGDIATTSLHATKLLNTGEGGACFASEPELVERLRRLRFFGHDDAKSVVEDGCNGKMTEIHAALGLANLPYLDQVMGRRREIYQTYRELLGVAEFLSWQQFDPASYNYSYMPVVFDTEQRLLDASARMSAAGIVPRRYFHPSLNTMRVNECVGPMRHSEYLATRILCLPSYTELTDAGVDRVAAALLG